MGHSVVMGWRYLKCVPSSSRAASRGSRKRWQIRASLKTSRRSVPAAVASRQGRLVDNCRHCIRSRVHKHSPNHSTSACHCPLSVSLDPFTASKCPSVVAARGQQCPWHWFRAECVLGSHSKCLKTPPNQPDPLQFCPMSQAARCVPCSSAPVSLLQWPGAAQHSCQIHCKQLSTPQKWTFPSFDRLAKVITDFMWHN